jgi:hypothetical protein
VGEERPARIWPWLLVGIREVQGSDKKLSIASRKVGHAGSNGRGTWFSEFSGRNLAFGMSVAMPDVLPRME